MSTATPHSRSLGSAVLAWVVMATAGLALSTLSVTPAAATPGPPQQRPANAVNADALPTTQIDGVVWKQAIAGTKVYAGGQFTNARPAGAAPGTQLAPRHNLLAYDITTGVLDSAFHPDVDGDVKEVAVSPDGSRVYIAGNFTHVAGQPRQHVAAFSTSTGDLVSTFAPALNGIVNALAVTNSTVYVGGAFNTANGVGRTRLAAFTTTGALLSWAPQADDGPQALLVAAGGTRVIVGGAFTDLDGAPAYGLGALDPTTGASVPFAANGTVRDYGPTASIYSLSTDGTNVYGTGYRAGDAGNFEGVFAVAPDTGRVIWLADCHGDTYDAVAMNNVVYSVSHQHNCANIGSFPEVSPRVSHRATAFSVATTGTVNHNTQSGYADFYGQGAPSAVTWFPDVDAGSYTGTSQGAWTVTANSSYLLLGGEFPKVNGTPQQGLVRFAVPSISPRKQGPMAPKGESAPTVQSFTDSSATVSWRTNDDRDDQNFTYQLYRKNAAGTTSTLLTTVSAASQFWNRPMVASFTDPGLQAATGYRYLVRVTDPSGNTSDSTETTFTTSGQTTPQDAYAGQVQADGASSYWRLDEPSGPAADDVGGRNLSLGAGVGRGTAGAILGSADTAMTFNGSYLGTAGTTAAVPAPSTFSEEAWFRTSSGTGGKILGFGNSASGASSSFDRQVYLDNTGHVIFGVHPGSFRLVQSTGSYNNGQWHHVVATLSTAGMALYVDGRSVATDASTTTAAAYSGYWRVGGDNLSGWPSAPSTSYLQGTIDDVAVYPTALTLTQVRNHYVRSGRTPP